MGGLLKLQNHQLMQEGIGGVNCRQVDGKEFSTGCKFLQTNESKRIYWVDLLFIHALMVINFY